MIMGYRVDTYLQSTPLPDYWKNSFFIGLCVKSDNTTFLYKSRVELNFSIYSMHRGQYFPCPLLL